MLSASFNFPMLFSIIILNSADDNSLNMTSAIGKFSFVSNNAWFPYKLFLSPPAHEFRLTITNALNVM